MNFLEKIIAISCNLSGDHNIYCDCRQRETVQ